MKNKKPPYYNPSKEQIEAAGKDLPSVDLIKQALQLMESQSLAICSCDLCSCQCDLEHQSSL